MVQAVAGPSKRRSRARASGAPELPEAVLLPIEHAAEVAPRAFAPKTPARFAFLSAVASREMARRSWRLLLVQLADLVGRQRAADDQVPVQVEEEFLVICEA